MIFDCSMLLYYPFWMFMGFTLHFYIIFGTNLSTGGPTRIAVFLPIQCFEEKEYQTESKRDETFGSDLFGTNTTHETWGGRRAARHAPHPCGSTDLLFPPIYIHIPREHPGAPRKPNSTAATFCIREIPSWSLRRCSARGGIDHGGPLYHLQGLTGDL